MQEGAEFRGHWAFNPVRPVPVPSVADAKWPVNEIDRFVLARLERVVHTWSSDDQHYRIESVARATGLFGATLSRSDA